jgi:hypothetical protein
MRTITPGHRDLLDVLVQLACHVAMAATKEPHERVPEDLKHLMRAIQHVDASDPSHKHSSHRIAGSYVPALIFVARHEPDLFPKAFARAIVHKLKAVQLWNIACDVVGLDIEGIDVARITDLGDHEGRRFLWNYLNDRTPDAMELLIAPQVFSRILNVYERVRLRLDQIEARNDHQLFPSQALLAARRL